MDISLQEAWFVLSVFSLPQPSPWEKESFNKQTIKEVRLIVAVLYFWRTLQNFEKSHNFIKNKRMAFLCSARLFIYISVGEKFLTHLCFRTLWAKMTIIEWADLILKSAVFFWHLKLTTFSQLWTICKVHMWTKTDLILPPFSWKEFQLLKQIKIMMFGHTNTRGEFLI